MLVHDELRRELERWRFLLSAAAGSFGRANHSVESIALIEQRLMLGEQTIDFGPAVSSGGEDVRG